ncbi:alkene reductase [Methylobacterium brachythecii]|uniref:2,4-dienoyl-CoA reductase-like NADH-dependent reductase (Old Yellow Enzyme family) n=1 Tax=Methylobacterium brachythecii TaxID=1176177 RepID=A0A7W6AJ20_9HYPH|nr:alkene reductase [Methylobacterium brachythecii]MBB3903371.1 2,4-dienoyl-CoA reductase-like NADH-dependent reductase (Old Yellow Enzyme family) [Methylobacterium brachythecii]GLS45452.1 alkene reductase [Methylobacterium brachythecii]
MPTLFDPLTLGALTVPNRVIMAPLTRSRASRDGIPTPIMAEYYVQRASAGLIISEAIGVSRQGNGFTYTPGLWTDAQMGAWKPITQAVHAAGGLIVAQLAHNGRAGHHTVIGEQPVSSSATVSPVAAWTYDGPKPSEMSRPLAVEEIPGLVASYSRAASNAIAAGFDGIQIHAANGMLIDQFLRNNSNARTDAYGGSIENRLRPLRQITQAVVEVVGADRTSVRLSPNGATWGVDDSDPTPLFTAAAEMLDGIGIGFLELKEHGPAGTFLPTDVPRQSPMMRRFFRGPLVLNCDYDRTRAQADLDSGLADAISFGRPFIANPDLVRRLYERAPLTPAADATFYTQGTEGYTDYPTLEDIAAVA